MPTPGERGGQRAGVALALMAKAFIIFNKTSTYQKKEVGDGREERKGGFVVIAALRLRGGAERRGGEGREVVVG